MRPGRFKFAAWSLRCLGAKYGSGVRLCRVEGILGLPKPLVEFLSSRTVLPYDRNLKPSLDINQNRNHVGEYRQSGKTRTILHEFTAEDSLE